MSNCRFGGLVLCLEETRRLLQNSVVEVAENWMEIVENGFVDLFS